MLSYSIAIRTLGKAGEKFIRELESLKTQTCQPESVNVYIAKGYTQPDCRIGSETYKEVDKGMMRQRLLPYEEIGSDLILFLDDDVELALDSVEKMIKTIEENNLDALGADIFRNHKMPLSLKIRSALVNLVTPHLSDRWAFKVRGNGSFSYHRNPKRSWYPSQSCGGPVWMIRRSVYNKLHLEDELWLDTFDFPYGEDQLQTYKIYKNGYKLGVLYDSGIRNLDARTESGRYHKDQNRIYIRTKASFAVWWRSVFKSSVKAPEKYFAALSFFAKQIWTLVPVSVLSLISFTPSVLSQYIRGNIDGWKFVHSTEFKSLHPYVAKAT